MALPLLPHMRLRSSAQDMAGIQMQVMPVAFYVPNVMQYTYIHIRRLAPLPVHLRFLSKPLTRQNLPLGHHTGPGPVATWIPSSRLALRTS
jgi:hypothetical protein